MESGQAAGFHWKLMTRYVKGIQSFRHPCYRYKVNHLSSYFLVRFIISSGRNESITRPIIAFRGCITHTVQGNWAGIEIITRKPTLSYLLFSNLLDISVLKDIFLCYLIVLNITDHTRPKILLMSLKIWRLKSRLRNRRGLTNERARQPRTTEIWRLARGGERVRFYMTRSYDAGEACG